MKPQDQALQERIVELERPEGASETMSVLGVIIYNGDTYRESYESYFRQYHNGSEGVRCSIDLCGIRFENPVTAHIDGKTVDIQEACFHPDGIIMESQLYDYSPQSVGPMVGPTLEMTGHFILNDKTQKLEGPIEREDGYTYYHYRPNGDYVFILESYTAP